MKKVYFTIIGIVSILSLNAQMQSQFISYTAGDMLLNYNQQVNVINQQDNSIDGSPHVFYDYMEGTIYSKKENSAFHLDLNINAYTNQFEFRHEGNVYAMPNFAFDSVVINQSTFIPVSEISNDKLKIFSMEIVDTDAKGNYLLKKYIVKFSEKQEQGPYNQAEPAQFKMAGPEYYFKNTENDLIPLNNLKKLSQKDGMPEDLASFIKKRKIKKNSEARLRELFSYVYER